MEAVTTCINSALDDCELTLKHQLYDAKDLTKMLIFSLSKLKTFVLICGRKLGSDASLICFLRRIEDIISKNTEIIHQLDEDNETDMIEEVTYDFNGVIGSLEEEMDEWYIKVLHDCTTYEPTADEVLEIITSFLQNLIHFRSEREWIDYVEMEQEISFMKSILGFVSKRCVVQVEPLKNLSAHTYSVTINLAHLFSRVARKIARQEDYEQLSTDFHVYRIYTRALSSSKLQRPLLASSDQDIMDDDTFAATKDFLDSLISNLWDLLRLNTYPSSSSSSFNDDLKELYGELRSMRVLLKHQNLQRQKIEDNIGEVVTDAGIFICSLHQGYAEDAHLVLLHNLLKMLKSSILLQSGAEQLSNKAEEENVQLAVVNKEDTGVKEVTAESYSHNIPSEEGATISLPNGPVPVGFHDDQTLIVDRLIRGSKKLQIVAIVGMPGLGKTTLATRVYTNPSVMDYFTIHAWTSVSQVVDKKKVLLDLFKQIDPTKCHAMSANPRPDFADGLRKSLKGRKYVIFLDDIWDIEAWNSLRASFPDDNVGSRMILTSRRHNVAPHNLMADGKPHYLRELNEEESVKLFQNKLSSGNGRLPPLSRDLGNKIFRKCRGLPLMIVIVAGVLKSMERDDWNLILDSIIRNDRHCRNTLELSYSHLPAHLRPCLLYFGAFKEDEEVSVRRLFRLWIAEGFIQKDNTNSPEEVAERYLRELVGRSLIMVAKQGYDGGVKACHIHDLLHEFCIQKAKDEHLFHFLKDYDELSAFTEPHTLRRLCIQSEVVQDFTESRLFCPQARSLIYNSHSDQFEPNIYKSGMPWVDISSTIQILKYLTVLDLEQVPLGGRFPTEIEQLVQLVFLAIRCSVIEIPSLIGKLSNLETFILQPHGASTVQLPESLWNLQKLQYFHIIGDTEHETDYATGAYLPESNLASSSTLDELDSFFGANIRFSKMRSLLGKIRNVRRLKCIISRDDAGEDLVVDEFSFEILKRLESFSLGFNYPLSIEFDMFSLPTTLKKLTLRNLSLSWKNLSNIGELPKLEVLKLAYTKLEGDTWEMKEGEFPRLRILKLCHSRLASWVINCDDDEEQLGYFEKLVLRSCHYLKELPFCLDIIPTLKVIEVYPDYAEQLDLAREIKKIREMKMGDSSLKIIVSRI